MPVTRPLRLTHGQVLTPTGFEDHSLTLVAGRIGDGPGREVDLSGLWVLPGIVDAHGDAFERHLAPRRGAVQDLSLGLRALEVELAANGITTGYLAQFWSWEGGMRSPDFARALAAALDSYAATLDLRLQLRLEIGCHTAFDAARDLIRQHQIGYVVFNDHLPHAALAQGKRPPRLEGQALKSRRAPEVHLALLRQLHEEMPLARAALGPLTADLTAAGVRLGSHDDVTAVARAAWDADGVEISEFPVSAEAAAAAKGQVIMGAPNVLRGGSHGKGVAAEALIEAGQVAALASDYHYPAPHLAAFKLADRGMPLAMAWSLISAGPARLLGLTDRGGVAPGQRADLVIIAPETRQIVGTIVHGRFAYLAADLAARVLA